MLKLNFFNIIKLV